MSDCIIAPGGRAINRYPRVYNSDHRNRSLHRVILAKKFNLDYDDDSWTAMHTCDNKQCINEEHLKVGTDSLNMKDCVAKKRHKESRKTCCPRGHPYTGYRSNGKRICRECDRIRDRMRRPPKGLLESEKDEYFKTGRRN